MHSLTFSQLNENLFQGIIIASSTPKLSSSEWLTRIIENSKNKSNLEFQPVLENGMKLLRFDNVSLSSSTIKSVEPVRCHCAMLDNKYYTTQIYLVELEKPIEFPELFYDFIHGIIIYLDNNDENCLKNVEKWIQYIDLMENCAIKILSCENATEQNVVSRIDIQNYCIDKGFELIELTPNENKNHNDEDDELEDDFKESNSFERLYKAIQAYVWPNLNYKEKHSSSYISSRSSDTLIKQINQLNFSEESSSTNSNVPYRRSEMNTDKSDIKTSKYNQINPPENNINFMEQEADRFENMLSKFSEMKEKASKFEDEERKRYAEQVAIAFWNSISDDQDEILFSSDEDEKGREPDPNHVYV